MKGEETRLGCCSLSGLGDETLGDGSLQEIHVFICTCTCIEGRLGASWPSSTSSCGGASIVDDSGRAAGRVRVRERGWLVLTIRQRRLQPTHQIGMDTSIQLPSAGGIMNGLLPILR